MPGVKCALTHSAGAVGGPTPTTAGTVGAECVGGSTTTRRVGGRPSAAGGEPTKPGGDTELKVLWGRKSDVVAPMTYNYR